MEKILEQLKKIHKNKRHYIIFNLLKDEDVDFIELSKIYTNYLKKLDKENRLIIAGLSIPLISYWCNENIEDKNQKIFLKCKAAYNLLKGRMFHTALIEKDLQKYIDKYKYKEDENGLHEYKFLDK